MDILLFNLSTIRAKHLNGIGGIVTKPCHFSSVYPQSLLIAPFADQRKPLIFDCKTTIRTVVIFVKPGKNTSQVEKMSTACHYLGSALKAHAALFSSRVADLWLFPFICRILLNLIFYYTNSPPSPIIMEES